ncbi:TolC family protein [Campylobacter fetus]|nr:TolC family protein [Campylobacter fetus]
MKTKIVITALLPICIFANDISLSTAYELALSNDEEVKASMYENLASSERRKQATSAMLPSIDAQILYNGERYDKSSGRSGKQRMDETFTKYGVNLTQPLFRPELWYQRKQEVLRESGYSIMYDGSKQGLARKVAEAYFKLAYANESLKLAKSYESANKAKYDQMQKSLDMGLANKMDTLEAKVRYDEAILDVNKALRQIEVAKLSLAKYVGEEVGVKNSFENMDLSFFSNLNLSPYENIFANLDYKQSEISTQIATEEKNKRMTGVLPTIDFSVGFSNSDYKDDARFGDEDNKVETMIRFTMPLFKSGLTIERIQEGELLKMSSMSKQLDMQKKVAIEQKQAISDFRNYLQEANIVRNSLEHARVYEQAIERGYEEGLKNIVDLLDARARVYKTKADALNAGYQLILGYLNLEYLIGNISIDTIRNLERAFNY